MCHVDHLFYVLQAVTLLCGGMAYTRPPICPPTLATPVIAILAGLSPPVPPISARSRSAPIVRPLPPPAPGPGLSDRPCKPHRWPNRLTKSDHYIQIHDSVSRPGQIMIKVNSPKSKLADRLQHSSVNADAFAILTACCDLDRGSPESQQVISRGW